MPLDFKKLSAGVVMITGLAACAPLPGEIAASSPIANMTTDTESRLMRLPPPEQKLVAAVYRFPDLTGQHKPNEAFPEYSRAVTQGATAILIKALQSAGAGRWFQVVEREGLANLLQERQLVRNSREAAAVPGAPLRPLPPLVNAGIILDGGIVGYETNTLTGGFGARYLGIGGSTEYRQDVVTVSLRAVSTLTGEVLTAVTATKTIFSAGVSAGVFKFVSENKLLEIETGLTTNEPTQLAVRKAIEKAVEALVVEGARSGYWKFDDPQAGQETIDSFLDAS